MEEHEMEKSNPVIGLDNFVYAKLLTDAIGTTPPTYGPVKRIPGAVQATVNPNSTVDTDYGDNGAIFVTNNRGNTEMSLEFTNIDNDTLAELLGQEKKNGVVIEKPLDQSQYFAVGFRVWVGGTDSNGNKIYEYFWFAKGKFSVPESGATTKKESMEFQHKSLTAQFVSTLYSEDGMGNGVYNTHCRTDDTAVPAARLANWFNAPVVAVTGNLSNFSVTASLDDGNIVLTGAKSDSSDFTFNGFSAIIGTTILIFDSLGATVSGTAVVSAIDDEPTITITPDEALSAGDYTVVVTDGLLDTNGVKCTPYSGSVTVS